MVSKNLVWLFSIFFVVSLVLAPANVFAEGAHALDVRPSQPHMTATATTQVFDSSSNLWVPYQGTNNATTTVSCTPSSVALGSSSTCMATVTGISPTGTVAFMQGTPGTGTVTFSPSPPHVRWCLEVVL